jgi:hypothetical protein
MDAENLGVLDSLLFCRMSVELGGPCVLGRRRECALTDDNSDLPD